MKIDKKLLAMSALSILADKIWKQLSIDEKNRIKISMSNKNLDDIYIFLRTKYGIDKFEIRLEQVVGELLKEIDNQLN